MKLIEIINGRMDFLDEEDKYSFAIYQDSLTLELEECLPEEDLVM